MELLSQFSDTEIQVSIDAAGTVNDFIRQGSTHTAIMANLQRYAVDSAVRRLKIYTVLSALNSDQMPALLDLLHTVAEQAQRHIDWWPTVLNNPAYLRAANLPLPWRQSQAQELRVLLDRDWTYLGCTHGIKHAIAALQVPQHAEGVHRLRQWLEVNDGLHSQDWRHRLPGLAHMMEDDRS
jgi:MoaA/NifB/PqqE/SkfB family radical SAM enzyme